MMQVTLTTKGKPDIILKFTDRKWAKIQAYMKRHGMKSFQSVLDAILDDWHEKHRDRS
jgi:hypothetical protein